MTLNVLDVYLDASGKRKNVRDKLIVVGGCVSTPEMWKEFDLEWQAVLEDYKFTPDEETDRFVFHTTDYQSGYCKFMPVGISSAEKQRIYRHLVKIVRTHSLFLVSYGVLLKDYNAFQARYPTTTRLWFGQPGSMVSILTTGKCIEWARQNGYSESVSLMFDQGDEFWGQMSTSFEAYLKDTSNMHFGLTVDSLCRGDKVEYAPIQAADIVAWECRQHFLNAARGRITLAGTKRRPELDLLSNGPTLFTCWELPDLEKRVQQLIDVELLPGQTLDIHTLEPLLKDLADKADAKKREKRERKLARKKLLP